VAAWRTGAGRFSCPSCFSQRRPRRLCVTNNFQVDGIDAKNMSENSASGFDPEVGIAIPAPDTIAEFKVQTAMYDAGYGSSSRLYERTASQLGMTPDKYRRGAVAATIRYTCTDSPMGRMLIAATDKGICAIQFADSDEELESGLKHEFPFAIRRRDDAALHTWEQNLLRQMHGHKLNSSLPLDIQATAFQRKVWAHLQSIPFGATQSYSEVAKAIRRPTATRAVARACATNRIAIAIPCHRVVRENGEMGGYRWGVERKKALLGMERAEA